MDYTHKYLMIELRLVLCDPLWYSSHRELRDVTLFHAGNFHDVNPSAGVSWATHGRLRYSVLKCTTCVWLQCSVLFFLQYCQRVHYSGGKECTTPRSDWEMMLSTSLKFNAINSIRQRHTVAACTSIAWDLCLTDYNQWRSEDDPVILSSQFTSLRFSLHLVLRSTSHRVVEKRYSFLCLDQKADLCSSLLLQSHITESVYSSLIYKTGDNPGMIMKFTQSYMKRHKSNSQRFQERKLSEPLSHLKQHDVSSSRNW